MEAWTLCMLALLGTVVGQSAEKRRTGNTCRGDLDCPDNAFCKMNSYCVCKEGYVYAAINDVDKGCLKEARHGEECSQYIQCHAIMGVHSECVSGVCQCRRTAHLEEQRCYENALIGERCQTDLNCYLGPGDLLGPVRQAYCVRGYCTCPLQYSSRDNGTRCVRDATLGELCEDALQCAGDGLECRNSKCRCREDWVAHNDTNSCVLTVKALGEPCDYDVQCDAFGGSPDARSPGAALCLGGVCACSYNARATGAPLRCWHRKRPGQECKRDEECVSEEDEAGYCLSGRCTCKTCSPDARDFGAASSMSRPPLLAAAIFSIAAILRH